MKRTQIYIDEDTFRFLEYEHKIKKKTISEIIRENIKKEILSKSNKIIKKMNMVYGIWKNRKIDVDEYIKNLRKDRKLW